MESSEVKVVIRLIGGLADGFVFAVPAAKIPPFVAVGPVANTSEKRATVTSSTIGSPAEPRCRAIGNLRRHGACGKFGTVYPARCL
jgi:hypothetical protein